MGPQHPLPGLRPGVRSPSAPGPPVPPNRRGRGGPLRRETANGSSVATTPAGAGAGRSTRSVTERMNELKGPLVLAAVSGLLLFAAFPPLDLGILGWVALVPLLVALHGLSVPRAGLVGAVAGGIAFLAMMAWLRVFGLLAWVLVAAFLAASVALFAILQQWIGGARGPGVALWTAPVAWTALEYLRSVGVFAFPWGLLGLTQHAYLPVLQVAKYAGV